MELHNAVFVSDSHGGSQLGLVPPDGVKLDGGNLVLPTPFQLKMYAMWREFWDEWVPEATDGEPYAMAHLGDAVDGNKHPDASLSVNLNDQRRIAFDVLAPEVRKAACYYHVRGTPTHVGEAAHSEETLAQELGALPNASGQYARYQLWLRMGKALIQAMHHIGTTSRTQSESVAVHAELVEAITEAGRWNQEIPDVVIRGHRHRHLETSIPTSKGRSFAIVCPGWQGKTPFLFKVGARQSEPQFGGVLLRWSDKRGELFVRSKVWCLEREQPE